MLLSIERAPSEPLASLSCELLSRDFLRSDAANLLFNFRISHAGAGTPLFDPSSANQSPSPVVDMQAYAGSPVTLTFCSRVSSPTQYAPSSSHPTRHFSREKTHQRTNRSSSLLFGTLPPQINITSTNSLLSLLDVIVQITEQPSSSTLTNRGYEKLQLSANDGAGGDAVYIWTLVAQSNASAGAVAAITGISVAVSDTERLAAAAAGYSQLPGNLNSGTGGAVVTLHIVRGSGRVAAGSVSSVEAALASNVLFGLVLAREPPANSTLVPGNLNQGVLGAAPLFLYSLAAPSTLTSVALTWKPCACSVGTHFICLAGIAASIVNSTMRPSYSPPLCARITVLARSAPNWTTSSSKSSAPPLPLPNVHKTSVVSVHSFTVSAFIGRRAYVPLTLSLEDPSRRPVITISSLSPLNVPLEVSATSLLSANVFTPHP
jgi:hypothetical protein